MTTLMRSIIQIRPLITSLCLFIVILNGMGNSYAKSDELVIATTFSPEATQAIVTNWNARADAIPIRTINRTSASLERLLDTEALENVDLILTSSPMLMHHLQQHNRLSALPEDPRILTAFNSIIIKRLGCCGCILRIWHFD